MKQEAIFIEYSPKSINFYEESFLDLEFAFDLNLNPFHSQKFELEIQNHDDMVFQPFADIHSSQYTNRNSFDEENHNESTSNLVQESTSNDIHKKNKDNIAKSKKTKNMCFNICQKTIKVIKTRIYHEKFTSFCVEQNTNSETVISNLLKFKKNLSGPKALQMFVEINDPTSRVFSKFMKWFLKQKYLRHAIKQGTMDDLKGYLQFKNEVILNIL